MRRGRMYRHMIDVLKPSTSAAVDKFGHPDLTVPANWTRHATLPALIEPVGGGESVSSDQVVAGLDFRVVVRYSATAAAIKPEWRLLWKEHGRYLNVVRVVNVGSRNFELEIVCKEKASVA